MKSAQNYKMNQKSVNGMKVEPNTQFKSVGGQLGKINSLNYRRLSKCSKSETKCVLPLC